MWNDKGPRRHKETWCGNEEVAEAVREKKIKYKSARKKIRKRQGWSIRRVEKNAKEKKQKECAMT